MQKDNFFWVGGKNTIYEISKWKKRTIKQVLSTKKINTSENLQETLVDPKKINKILYYFHHTYLVRTLSVTL